MRDEARPIERRLCIASLLLDLDDRSAQGFVKDCLDGKHGDEARQNATFVLVRSDQGANSKWRQEQLPSEYCRGEQANDHSTAWDALCQKVGELKLHEAVEPLIANLQRTPTDRASALALGTIGDPPRSRSWFRRSSTTTASRNSTRMRFKNCARGAVTRHPDAPLGRLQMCEDVG